MNNAIQITSGARWLYLLSNTLSIFTTATGFFFTLFHGNAAYALVCSLIVQLGKMLSEIRLASAGRKNFSAWFMYAVCLFISVFFSFVGLVNVIFPDAQIHQQINQTLTGQVRELTLSTVDEVSARRLAAREQLYDSLESLEAWAESQNGETTAFLQSVAQSAQAALDRYPDTALWQSAADRYYTRLRSIAAALSTPDASVEELRQDLTLLSQDLEQAVLAAESELESCRGRIEDLNSTLRGLSRTADSSGLLNSLQQLMTQMEAAQEDSTRYASMKDAADSLLDQLQGTGEGGEVSDLCLVLREELLKTQPDPQRMLDSADQIAALAQTDSALTEIVYSLNQRITDYFALDKALQDLRLLQTGMGDLTGQLEQLEGWSGQVELWRQTLSALTSAVSSCTFYDQTGAPTNLFLKSLYRDTDQLYNRFLTLSEDQMSRAMLCLYMQSTRLLAGLVLLFSLMLDLLAGTAAKVVAEERSRSAASFV